MRARLDRLPGLLCAATTVALGVALQGCGGSSSASTSGAGGPPIYSSEDNTGFLALVPDAIYEIAYRGKRLVDLRYDYPVLYTEDVGSDGQGKFSVVTLDVLSGHPNAPLFMMVADMRQVLTYRFRDFRIGDYALFLQNYDHAILQNATVVAGVDCVQVSVERRAGSNHRYVADVDPTNGIVMRWEEFDSDTGALLARVEFTEFELGGDTSDLQLIERQFDTVTYDLATTDFESVLGYLPLIPDFPPDAALQVGPTLDHLIDSLGGEWVKVYLTDGVEEAILMHQPPDGGPLAKRGYVEFAQVSSWAAVRGKLKGYEIMMASKFSQSDLELALQSALPKGK